MSGLRRFLRSESGAAAALYALALPALVVAGGVAFDYSRLAGLDSEMQNAADQAALAGATQLDGKSGACSRASSAALNLVSNDTILADEGIDLTWTAETACDQAGVVRFWQNEAKTVAATSDAAAKFVEIVFDDADGNSRTARYALTPVTGLFVGEVEAAALAGLGSSICKVPPIMICSPDPTIKFNAAGKVGLGIVATGHSPGNSSSAGNGTSGGTGGSTSWAPGDFGFLQIEDTGEDNASKNARLLRALAYANPPMDCTKVGDNKVNTGNPQGLYDAINTRFDMYDFPSNGGNVLSSCQDGNCPPSPNVVKDFIKKVSGKGNNACKVSKNGWDLPDLGSEFKPEPDTNSDGIYSVNTPAAMGLPRDLCHYTSFNGTGLCGGGTGRFGNGLWAKQDYFKANHPSVTPPSGINTRYDVYRWELGKLGAGGQMPNVTNQTGTPVCFNGSSGVDISRRVMTVAVVSNCAALHGSSVTVDIDEWVDVFLVEPSIDDARRYNAFKDGIYFEIIGPSSVAGAGTYATQQVRRDVPYLVQ